MQTKPLQTIARLAKVTKSDWAPVKLSRIDGRMTYSTNRDGILIRYDVPHPGPDLAPVIVSAADLRHVVTGDNIMEIARDGARLVIGTDIVRASIPIRGDATAPEVVGAGGSVLGADDMKAIRWVRMRAADGINRYGLSCIHVEGRQWVTTDGNALHTATVKGEPVDLPPKRTIPLGVLDLALKLCPGGMTVAIVGESVTLSGGGWTLAQPLHGAEFPAWRSVLPEKWTAHIRADAASLRRAVEAVAGVAMTRSDKRAVLTVDAGRMMVKARSYDMTCDAVSSVDVRDTLGAYEPRGFGVHYLLDALKGAKGDVVWSWAGPLSPSRMVRADGHEAILMPVRLD